MSILLALQGPVEVNISGAVLEGSDSVAGTVELAVSISGAILEGSDVVAGTIDLPPVEISGAITEGSDAVSGAIEVVAAADIQPSGGYWPDYGRPGGKRRKRREELEEGILPPEERQEAQEAVSAAIAASQHIVATQGEDVGKYLLDALEARRKYDEAYKMAYKGAYIAEVVAELWKKDIRRAQRNRAVALLLLN